MPPNNKKIVVMLSTDRKIFEVGSSPRQRMIEYGTLFQELHIIVASRKSHGLHFSREQLSANVFAYPTDTSGRFAAISRAKSIGRSIIAKIPKENRKNIVVDAQDPFETGLVGKYLSRLYKTAFRVQIHTDFLSPSFAAESFLNKMRVYVAGGVLAKATHVRTVSQRIKNSVMKRYGIPEQKISVLPILFSNEKFLGEPKSVASKFAGFSPIVLTVCRLESEKNIAQALRVFAEVLPIRPNAAFIVVGEGSQKESLARLVNNLGVEKNVFFELWQKDLRPYYAVSQVYLSTSSYEGFGVSLLEAALNGLAILSTDVGLMNEVLLDGVHAKICLVGDESCLVQKLQELLVNKDLCESLGLRAKEQAQKIFMEPAAYLDAYKKDVEKAFVI